MLARVPLDVARLIVDLGCGPGNSTALLRTRWPTARVVGVDNSGEMLRRARADWPELEWVHADIREYRSDTPPDLLFANALLQWLPDHESLIPRLFESLHPGGVLAVQMPRNFNEPSHRLMRELGAQWKTRLDSVRSRWPVESPTFYYDLLAPRAQRIDIWQTIEYESGSVGIIENSKLANFSNALQISCAHGILHLPIAWAIQGEVTITQTHRKPDWDFILEDTYKIAKINAYALQLEDFCRVVPGTTTPLVPLHDSVVNAMTTEALVASLKQGRAVDVEPVDF